MDRFPIEPGGWCALRILLLEQLLELQHPSLIPALPDARNIIGSCDTCSPAKLQQILSGEAARSLGRLRGEHFCSQLVESVCLCGERQGIVRTHRLGTQEAPHPVFDGHVARFPGGSQQLPGNLLKLTAKRTLWIFKEDQPPLRLVTAQHDAAFRCVS